MTPTTALRDSMREMSSFMKASGFSTKGESRLGFLQRERVERDPCAAARKHACLEVVDGRLEVHIQMDQLAARAQGQRAGSKRALRHDVRLSGQRILHGDIESYVA